MVFSGMTFLYAFLPLVIISYFLCKNRVYRNTVLLLFSILFYSWGEPKLVLVMLLASLVAYLAGLGIDKNRKNKKRKKQILIAALCILVGNLVFFKYLNFIGENVKLLLNMDFNLKSIVLPIGISFYTFQILSYVVDLYKGKVMVQKNYFYLTLYVAFFPQLIAGPIVRYETVEKEISQREENVKEFAQGLRRFISGLFKKAVIANSVATIPVIIYGGDELVYGSFMYFVAGLAYALQIYFDFSGYSDMAIGLGRIFGFHFPDNFDYPYVSTSITHFWRRWHISLSTWFRDYIYIPLGGNRVKRDRFIFNILFVWALTGLWHGADWNFIIWGLYYGIILLFEKLLWGEKLEKLPKLFGWVYTMFLVIIGWVIFNSSSLGELIKNLDVMFSFIPTDFNAVVAADAEILMGVIYIPLGLLCMLPIRKKLKLRNNGFTRLWVNVFYLIMLAVSIMFIISGTYNPFIYFRF